MIVHSDERYRSSPECVVRQSFPEAASSYLGALALYEDKAPFADEAQSSEDVELEGSATKTVSEDSSFADHQYDLGNSLSVYYREVKKTNLLSAEEERELSYRAQAGDVAAVDHMVRANQRLVIKVARRYEGRGVSLPDLIQEGNIGLIRAVEGYDPNRGFRFSTYAVWWIRRTILHGIANQSRTIRLPKDVGEDVGRMVRMDYELTQSLGHQPTDDELASALGVSGTVLAALQGASRLQYVKSLDEQLSSDSDTVLGNSIEDPGASVEDSVIERSLKGTVTERLKMILNLREIRIIQLRFGLDGNDSHTQAEIAKEFELSRERIRQIEHNALEKLRQSSSFDDLRDYLS